jgi:hypothetical protein
MAMVKKGQVRIRFPRTSKRDLIAIGKKLSKTPEVVKIEEGAVMAGSSGRLGILFDLVLRKGISADAFTEKIDQGVTAGACPV